MSPNTQRSATMHKPTHPLLGVALAIVFLLAAPWANAQSGPVATRFTPVAGDDSVKQLADSLGNTPEERQQILQLAGAGKELFAQKYKGRWDNTLAGAMAFFIVGAYIVNAWLVEPRDESVGAIGRRDDGDVGSRGDRGQG